ncbi:MAG TPA: C40 family peptidase [Acidimicrobiia bacterium]|nr:C40 family peptidase [Acidimicrobiia bacterium]
MSVPGITSGDGFAAVQSRISEIQARFGIASPVAFNALLANQLGGIRTASSFSGEVPNRMPAGLSPVIDLAQQHLGVPYVWGGESPSGFDCSGLIQYVYRQLGVSLPRVAADQARVGEPVASLADAVPGDLVAFNDPVDHIGIYAGNGLMVVAPKAGDVVKVQAIYKEPTAIRRVLPSTPAPSFLPDQAVQRSVLLSALGLAS